MKCLVIIPAYNEEENIVRVVENLKNNYPMYDYVVINDGSADSTAKICRKYGYELVDLPVNLGLAGAFQTGLKYAYRKGYDYAIQFDADGQHRPEFIAPMLDKIQEGYDIVIASRFVTASPRSTSSPWNGIRRGTFLKTFALLVMTSPTSPLPRVTALKSPPFR